MHVQKLICTEQLVLVQLRSMELIVRILWNALGLLAIAMLLPGIVIDSFYSAIIAAIVLGLLNAFIRPILFILTLPITILTLGLFALVLNAALFLFAASFIDGFFVSNFWYAIIGSILVSLVSTAGNKLID